VLITEIENLHMHIEFYSLKFIQLTDENENNLKQLNHQGLFLENYNNEIENYKTESEDLNKKLEKSQDLVRVLRSQKEDLDNSNNDFRSKVQALKSKED